LLGLEHCEKIIQLVLLDEIRSLEHIGQSESTEPLMILERVICYVVSGENKEGAREGV
jgi:hypothetical protein